MGLGLRLGLGLVGGHAVAEGGDDVLAVAPVPVLPVALQHRVVRF